MNQPVDHHYIPVFYLSRWVGNDGRLCRFSKPNGNEVRTKRVAPRGTAFEPGLYEARDLPPELAQTMESDFMAKVDSTAAEALALLEQGLPEEEWSQSARNGWSRFMLALGLRGPDDIAQLKSSVAEAGEQRNLPKSDEFALSVGRNLMGHSAICHIISRMHWQVLDVLDGSTALLTSDRPVWMTATLAEQDACIVFPIGPRKLFSAVVDRSTQQKLQAKSMRDLVETINRFVVQHAVKYVYGLGAGSLPFVQQHMATKRQSTLMERLARSHGHELVASKT